ncbi:helix-turn-helix domain-containing protein [Streptomyces sp. NPDC020983]|uniref:transcriptional regulator n=1 Tax=Streptomyces sp. NPDC020983 TaxID=3365106 RepID=UPI0037B43D37
MAGAAEDGPAERFATLLHELKDRSGLSYGTLARRLHMSTSTLHRYCNGTAFPNDYAPVERLARVCKASPRELVELHRHWVLADAARAAAQERRRNRDGRPGAVLAAGGPETAAPGEAPAATTPDAPAGPDASTTPDAPAGPDASAAPGATGAPAGPDAPSGPDEPVVVSVTGGPAAPRRRRSVLAASAAAAVLVAVGLAVHPPWAGGAGSGEQDPGDAGKQKAVAASAPQATPTPETPSPPTRGPSASPHRKAAVASAEPSSPAPGTSAAPADGGTAVPITVRTRAYVYDNPCSQHFLVDSEPAQMGPPANEENAPRWAAAYGAVASDEQRVALTVQGTGAQTVVLEALHVRIESRNAPLAWNDYAMGSGCGGDVESASFFTDLDSGSPTVTVRNGQRDFPYSVTESDPEVFYVTARTRAHDVRWDLTLDWSSGGRHGTVRVSNDGTPFRTSADVNRPGYDYPPGYSDWIPRTS